MSKLLGCVLSGILGATLVGCGQPAQPVGGGAITVHPKAPVEMVREKAGVGSGQKGRSLDPHEGIIVTPAKTFFTVKEKLAFEILVPDAMNRFNAYEGRWPKSHQEFMERIVGENQIKLPDLPEGHKYVYEPKTHELMVEKPAP